MESIISKDEELLLDDINSQIGVYNAQNDDSKLDKYFNTDQFLSTDISMNNAESDQYQQQSDFQNTMHGMNNCSFEDMTKFNQFGNIVYYNGNNGYIDAPPIHKRPYNYNSNDINEFDHSPYAESLTLGSESRTSNEFFSRTSNELFSRDSIEFFDSSLTNVDSLEQVESRKSRFANSISNSISSIFKNDNKPSRFNLKGINPLSTHRDINSLGINPNNLVDNVENLSIENDDPLTIAKKKRSTTNSILSSLTNARLGFNSNKSDKKPLHETVIKEEENEFDQKLDFNDELEMVISLASRNSSTYNFNSPRTSTDTRYTDALQHQPLRNSIIEEEYLDPILVKNENDEDEKLSPDYGALFSNVTAPKKRSKTLSFKRLTSQVKKEECDTLNLSAIADDDEVDRDADDEVTPEHEDQNKIVGKGERIKEYPSISEDGSIQIIPMKESTRGRKPSLEYDATKTFVCTNCSRRFRRQEHLKRHYRSIHTNQKPFDCPLCNKKFSRSDNLTQHIKTHEREEF